MRLDSCRAGTRQTHGWLVRFSLAKKARLGERRGASEEGTAKQALRCGSDSGRETPGRSDRLRSGRQHADRSRIQFEGQARIGNEVRRCKCDQGAGGCPSEAASARGGHLCSLVLTARMRTPGRGCRCLCGLLGACHFKGSTDRRRPDRALSANDRRQHERKAENRRCARPVRSLHPRTPLRFTRLCR